MGKNRGGTFLGGLLVGTVVGAVTGLLVAPRTGRETRRFLKQSVDALPELAEDLGASLSAQADRLSESALRNWEETLIRLREALAAGMEASQQERRRSTAETVSVSAYSYDLESPIDPPPPSDPE